MIRIISVEYVLNYSKFLQFCHDDKSLGEILLMLAEEDGQVMDELY